MNPIRSLHSALTRPFKAVFVVGLCLVINVVTSPGHWWVQWVALGMGIAVLVAWWRALKVLVAGGALLALAAWWQRRGEDARRRG